MFRINPEFRLSTPYISLKWHLVDLFAVQCRAATPAELRYTFFYKKVVQVAISYNGDTIDAYYHAATNFDVRGFQKWLRERFRDIIFHVADSVLPERVRYWENLYDMHGSGVEVKRLRNRVLGCCSVDNFISLQPFLILMKAEWVDEVILHEIAHYVHKNHRKPFWDLLTKLLGHDARRARRARNEGITPFYPYYLFLTRK